MDVKLNMSLNVGSMEPDRLLWETYNVSRFCKFLSFEGNSPQANCDLDHDIEENASYQYVRERSHRVNSLSSWGPLALNNFPNPWELVHSVCFLKDQTLLSSDSIAISAGTSLGKLLLFNLRLNNNFNCPSSLGILPTR